MIDAAAIEQHMRDANPIPSLADIDDDELSRAVAAVRTRTAANVEAASHGPTRAKPTTPVRPRRLRSVWAFAAAFILVLIVVGSGALLMPGDNGPPPADERAPTTNPQTPTTLAKASPPPVEFDDTMSWSSTRVAEDWARSIVDVASLPSGGFVVVTKAPRGVLWSPDGAEWSDADPQQRVTAHTATHRHSPPQVISTVGDRVAILDSTGHGLWVGDPRAGAWESIRFDAASTSGDRALGIASSDTEVFILAKSDSTEYVAWLVDVGIREVERHPIPVVLPTRWEDELTPTLMGRPAVEWVNDRWVVTVADTVLVSPDGAAWTQVPDADSFHDVHVHPVKPVLWVTHLAAGPTGVIANTCEGWGHHYVWFSEDGLKWHNTGVENGHDGSTYSEAFGFLAVDGETHQIAGSPDGRTWHTMTWHAIGIDPEWTDRAPDGDLNTFDVKSYAASKNTVFVAHGEGAFLLTYGVPPEPRLPPYPS